MTRRIYWIYSPDKFVFKDVFVCRNNSTISCTTILQYSSVELLFCMENYATVHYTEIKGSFSRVVSSWTVEFEVEIFLKYLKIHFKSASSLFSLSHNKIENFGKLCYFYNSHSVYPHSKNHEYVFWDKYKVIVNLFLEETWA